MLRGMDRVAEFDEKLFGMLVAQVLIMNLVPVEFVLRPWLGRRRSSYKLKYILIYYIKCARSRLLLQSS